MGGCLSCLLVGEKIKYNFDFLFPFFSLSAVRGRECSGEKSVFQSF